MAKLIRFWHKLVCFGMSYNGYTQAHIANRVGIKKWELLKEEQEKLNRKNNNG